MDSKIEKARKAIKIAEDLVNIAYPLIREGKIILKSLEKIGESINLCIEYALEKEGITYSLNPFEDFKKISQKYLFSKEKVNEIEEILKKIERRRKSPMEFSRKNKAVLMNEDLNIENITLEKLKQDMVVVNELLRKIELSEKTS